MFLLSIIGLINVDNGISHYFSSTGSFEMKSQAIWICLNLGSKSL